MLEREGVPSKGVEFDSDDDVIIVFTGGTTSDPKCVRFGCEALDHFLTHIHQVVGSRPIDSFLADTPPQVLYALKMGYIAYVNKGRKIKRARSMLELIQKGAIDACFTSPYLWVELMRMGELTSLPPSLHTILLGSAPVTRDFLRKLGEVSSENTSIFCIYGMTEVGIISTVSAELKVQWNGDGDLVGDVVGGIRVELNTKESDMGEIFVYSPSLYSGYLGKKSRNSDAPLETGDLGRWVDVDGRKMLALVGRLKDMIIRNGFNLYPQTYESKILERIQRSENHIRQCALVGVWNSETSDEEVVLFVECSSEQKGELQNILSLATEVCGVQAAPDHCFGLIHFPVTGRQNKLDKKKLSHQAAVLLGRDPNKGFNNG